LTTQFNFVQLLPLLANNVIVSFVLSHLKVIMSARKVLSCYEKKNDRFFDYSTLFSLSSKNNEKTIVFLIYLVFLFCLFATIVA